MQNKTISFGGVPITVEQTDLVLNNEEKKHIEEQIMYGKEESVQTSENIFLLDNPIMKRIKDHFMKIIDRYTEEVMQINNKFVMISSWCAVNFQDRAHHPHRHLNSVLSLVYYVQCESGALNLKIDRSSYEQGFNFDYDIKNYNYFNSRFLNVDVKTNDVVIFPSWIEHSTHPNKSPKPRIVIAADYFPTGVLGSEINNDYLNITVNAKS